MHVQGGKGVWNDLFTYSAPRHNVTAADYKLRITIGETTLIAISYAAKTTHKPQLEIDSNLATSSSINEKPNEVTRQIHAFDHGRWGCSARAGLLLDPASGEMRG